MPLNTQPVQTTVGATVVLIVYRAVPTAELVNPALVAIALIVVVTGINKGPV